MAETTAESERSGKTLGLERYLQFGFIAGAVAVAYVLGHLIEWVWNLFAEPDVVLAQLAAAGIGIVAAIVCYKHPRIHELANEVTKELAKVTWPTREETKTATVVVIITTVIAAAVLGGMDFFWSWLTDLIYTG